LVHEKLVHDLGFVVVFETVVPGYENFINDAKIIEFGYGEQAIFEHVAGGSVIFNARAEHDGDLTGGDLAGIDVNVVFSIVENEKRRR